MVKNTYNSAVRHISFLFTKLERNREQNNYIFK